MTAVFLTVIMSPWKLCADNVKRILSSNEEYGTQKLDEEVVDAKGFT